MEIEPIITPLNIELSPIELFRRLELKRGNVLLESSLYHPQISNQSIIAFNPKKIIELETSDLKIPSNTNYFIEEYLQELRQMFNAYKTSNNKYFPGGLIGYFSYDFGLRFENVISKNESLIDLPELFFGVYENALVYDHDSKRWFATGIEDVNQIIKLVYERLNQKPLLVDSQESVNLKSNFLYNDYINAVNKVKDYIKNGDIYQANLTHQFYGHTEEKAIDIYTKLRLTNPAPYSAILCVDKDRYILSSSPELFLDVDGKRVQTRPIKGTIQRGKTIEEDEKLKEQLLSSKKDEAELVMIVDLERNDLNRVCKTNSVQVNPLKQIETFASVHHLFSCIFGELDDESDVFDLIRASFPGGSITGAPKIRAMQIINELEPHKRGIYTGSIGYIGFNNKAKFNIAIRTIAYNKGKIAIGLGGGIVADSIPELEYQETLHKGKAIFEAIGAKIL